MMTVDEDVVSKGRGGMDLAWVLLIRIRSLFLFSCSPVLWSFHIVFFFFAHHTLHVFCATLFLHCFALFFSLCLILLSF
jgi:hypothetical protein